MCSKYVVQNLSPQYVVSVLLSFCLETSPDQVRKNVNVKVTVMQLKSAIK